MRIEKPPGGGFPEPLRPTTYMVAEGDTLPSVAGKHNIEVNSLASANLLPIDAKLTPGQELVIPFRGLITGTGLAGMFAEDKLEKAAGQLIYDGPTQVDPQDVFAGFAEDKLEQVAGQLIYDGPTQVDPRKIFAAFAEEKLEQVAGQLIYDGPIQADPQDIFATSTLPVDLAGSESAAGNLQEESELEPENKLKGPVKE